MTIFSGFYTVERIILDYTLQRIIWILAEDALRAMATAGETALDEVESKLPSGFPMAIHESVSKALKGRLKSLKNFL